MLCKEFFNFRDGGPPIVVISLHKNLFSRKRIQKLQIGKGLLQGHAPGNIARNDHGIACSECFFKKIADPFGMIFPAFPENVHRLFGSTGKMCI